LQIGQDLQKCKLYLKAGYPTHVLDEKNHIASHCRVWGLSDPIDAKFHQSCEHIHSENCPDCSLLISTLAKIKTIFQDSKLGNKDELLFDIITSTEAILGWQKHILRGSQQEYGKQKILATISTSCVYWLRDWGMKILPRKFRETQKDWFGKKGIANHIDCLFILDNTGIIKKVTYVTLIDNCVQDSYSVLCVFKHVLEKIKKDFPND
jgi:hypothetical protein